MLRQWKSTPPYNRNFQIQCDASDYVIGRCLSQNGDDGKEKPLAFASSKLTDVQRRWSTIEKEAYAVVYSLEQFYPIVIDGHRYS